MAATFDERDGGTTVTMRMAFETAKERDQAVKVFGAVEGRESRPWRAWDMHPNDDDRQILESPS